MAEQDATGDVPAADPPHKKLSEFKSRDVAEELCLMDSELLRKIDPAELQHGAWMKKDKVCDPPTSVC